MAKVSINLSKGAQLSPKLGAAVFTGIAEAIQSVEGLDGLVEVVTVQSVAGTGVVELKVVMADLLNREGEVVEKFESTFRVNCSGAKEDTAAPAISDEAQRHIRSALANQRSMLSLRETRLAEIADKLARPPKNCDMCGHSTMRRRADYYCGHCGNTMPLSARRR